MSRDASQGPLPTDEDDRQHYRLVQAVVHAALELPVEQRPSFIADACRHDPEAGERALFMVDGLRTEETLRHQTRSQSADDVTSDLINAEVGAYRLVRRLGIGQGGMAHVYLATRRTDFSQNVAVKIMRRDTLTAAELERFRQERQILASLSHPNIARLFDGGTLVDGRPYLVMEYIEGETISDYALRHRLDLRQRLSLFRTICDAVQYAHRHLVVHRDLKPTNVLVDRAGLPKLLDFGIAKLLASDRTGDLQPTNVSGSPEGPYGPTPGPCTAAYASPEQLRGEPCSTTTDVYSLGIVLYELLTGGRPFEPAQHAVRALRDVQFEMPSVTIRRRAAASGRRAKYGATARIPRELDAIVALALRWDPDARYASVEALSGDVTRYLRGEPVSPRRSEPLYVLSCHLRQHRTLVASVALALAGFSIGTAGLYQRWKAELAARVASEARDDLAASIISRFVAHLAASAPTTADDRAALTQLTDGTATYLDKRARELPRKLNPGPAVGSRALSREAAVPVVDDHEAAKMHVDALAALAVIRQRGVGTKPPTPEAATRVVPEGFVSNPLGSKDVFGALEAKAQRRLDDIQRRALRPVSGSRASSARADTRGRPVPPDGDGLNGDDDLRDSR